MSYEQDPATESKQPPSEDLDLDDRDPETTTGEQRIGSAHVVRDDDDDDDDFDEHGVANRTPKLPEREQEEAEIADTDIMESGRDDEHGEGPDA